MAKNINKLTTLQVKQLNKPGWYADGNGLYLQVSYTGSKSWVFRYQTTGKERRCGLGSYPTISLIAARDSADDCRKSRLKGIDPIEQKRRRERVKQLEKAKTFTFKECATAYIESHKAGWKNAKHCTQWTNTLTTYAYPIIGDLPVQEVDTALVMNILEPIWYTKNETASRVRSRVENVLSWAKVRQYRTGENPALWRGHLNMLLPQPSKIQKVKHFEAMPYADIPCYFKSLRESNTLTCKALAFTILTASRSSESRKAAWNEFDFEKNIWTIPEHKMKNDKTHRVPLTNETLKILDELKAFKRNDGDIHIFPSYSNSGFISENTMLKKLKLTNKELTVHGFRSSFKDWCAEETNFQNNIVEAALAHTIKNATQAAYERGDKLRKREKIMDAWTNYCLSEITKSNATPMKKRA